MTTKPYISKILPNQTRVWLAPLQETKAITIMIFFHVGSRYENARNNGVSHFLEHLFFKGTKNRPTTLDISKELDGVGADYNAFTGKDMTAYYIKLNADHQAMAIDVLSDMLHHSLFDPKEIERERGVILEEINMYRDNPLMRIEDLFEETLFQGDPLGRNIAGPPSVIKRMTRDEIMRYRAEHYRPKNTVIAIAGNFEPDSMMTLLKKHFNHQKNTGSASKFTPARLRQAAPRIAIEYKDTNQAQMALGLPALPYGDPDLPALHVLSTILGGNMSSRLFIQIRERRGLCYSIRSGASSYEDTGVFNIRAGLDRTRLKEALQAIMEEVGRMAAEDVTDEELDKAKEFIKGKMILGFEDSEKIADFMGMQELFQRRVETPDERFKKIQSVTRQDLRRIARGVFRPAGWNLTIVGPSKPAEGRQLLQILRKK